MENRKTTLDREPVSSEVIRGKQNFNQVLKGHQALKPPLWKTAWFYGPVGLASFALIVAVSNMKPDRERNDQTLNSLNTQEEVVQEANTQFFSETNSTVVSKKETLQIAVSKSTIPQGIEPITQPLEQKIVAAMVTEEPIVEAPPVDKPIVVKTPVVKVKKAKRFKTMPNIAGVFTGKLQIDELCDAGKISCNNDFVVYSYDIQYYNGYGDVIERVKGDKFPPFLCNKLRTYNLNQEVMITNILAKNDAGVVERLISMRIEPTF